MAKQQSNLKYIYKIHSSRIRKSNWNLDLSIQEAKDNDELVSLSDSFVLRTINKDKNIEEKASEIAKQIRKLKKLKVSSDNKKEIKSKYTKLYNTLFIRDYVCIIIDKLKDFDRMNDIKGFFINGEKFKRLLATNGGVKKSTVVYVSEKVYDELHSKIENDRNLTKPLVPAKLEAYKSLSCSVSIPVSFSDGLLVVKDCETHFTDNIILLDDTQSDYPKMEYKENYPITLNENDGYGLICPELSEKWTKELGENYIASGFCIRNSFCKGMAFTFDYHKFAEKKAKNNMVIDAWGKERDIRNVQLILTTSMLKLWDSYDSMEHYLKCCDDNGYTFSITKMTPEKLENERNLNYQFIQSYEFSDEDIDELINPTVQEISDVLGNDPIKSILFLKGIHMSEESYNHQESDFIKALMIDKKMINDPFVRNKINQMIKKRITDAKIGVLRVHSNFQIICGDPYSLCQSMFGLEVTGLLKKGEFYSKYWNDENVDKVVCYRAPMTCHNNVRILRLKNNRRLRYWYKYLTTVTLFNSWDTTSHALNGADRDSDAILTTNSDVLIRNTRELPAVLCVQKLANKVVVTEKELAQSNKDGFGDEIGSTTNRITGMIDVASSFDKDSKEYEELQYRIICGQNYQQNAIDKMKGIICKPMPKEWYDYHAAKDSKDKDFNLSILADKKPYFFIYNYKHELKRYNSYINRSSKNCLMRFNISLTDLLSKNDRNEDEEKFVYYYYRKMPVFINKSTMNKICWRLEGIFSIYKETIDSLDFDYSILKSDTQYSKDIFNAIQKIYNEYSVKLKQYMQTTSNNKTSKEDKQITRFIHKESFKKQAYEICNDSDELCNIVVDLCYRNNSSKQFAWDICGDIIIENLLKKNNYTIHFPIADDNGDILYAGERFSVLTKKLDCEDNNEIDFE
ncbi:MAG TPA: hypothetical protein DEG71_01195 [Clostridiales bacterium]|nr:hypothetical protein [Clostridiales bacterium]